MINFTTVNAEEAFFKKEVNTEVLYNCFQNKTNANGANRLQCILKTKEDKTCDIEIKYKTHNAKRHLYSAHPQNI